MLFSQNGNEKEEEVEERKVKGESELNLEGRRATKKQP